MAANERTRVRASPDDCTGDSGRVRVQLTWSDAERGFIDFRRVV
jgi:hypothetical protein